MCSSRHDTKAVFQLIIGRTSIKFASGHIYIRALFQQLAVNPVCRCDFVLALACSVLWWMVACFFVFFSFSSVEKQCGKMGFNRKEDLYRYIIIPRRRAFSPVCHL